LNELSKIAFAIIRLGHEKAHLFAPITTLAEGATHALRLAMHQVAVALGLDVAAHLRDERSGRSWWEDEGRARRSEQSLGSHLLTPM